MATSNKIAVFLSTFMGRSLAWIGGEVDPGIGSQFTKGGDPSPKEFLAGEPLSIAAIRTRIRPRPGDFLEKERFAMQTTWASIAGIGRARA